MQHKDVEQVHMIIAFESLDYYDPERYILSVVNSLLGGNVNSRLFQTIREEMGLSYAIYSYGSSYEKGGLFHIYAAVHPNQVRPVLKAVVDIIQKLKNELVSDRELYIVKESVKTDLIISDVLRIARSIRQKDAVRVLFLNFFIRSVPWIYHDAAASCI